MSRAFSFVVATVIYIIAYVLHTISAYIFHPDGELYAVAASAENLDGAARAAFWSQFFIVWLPLIMVGGITLWVVVREYRRQTATRPAQVRR
jgi:succinate dehydrogenase hydrophobic anchor subunit